MNTPGATYKNITESQLIHSGNGIIHGVVVNSHSSGTMQLEDGVDNTNGANATGTLTITTLAPAKFAESILTISDVFSDGEVIVIGAITYRMKTTPAQAYDVAIGASGAVSLDNLKLAINATGVGDGSDYYAGTEAHPLVIATANTDTTQKINSRTYGTGNNTLATTTDGANASWEDTTLGGGTGSSIAGVATADSTFVIDGETYYFTTILSETLFGDTDEAVANEILWVTNDATALDNMKSAINGTGTEGTTYATGTNAHPSVIATTNGNTTQVVEAKVFGTLGNSITTTETGSGMSWGGATLSGGTDASRQIGGTYTFATGSSVITFPEPIAYVNGLFVNVGNTANLTIVYNKQ